jgi:hypothetical protein
MYDGRSLGGCQVESRVSVTPAYHWFLFVLFVGYHYDAYVTFVFTSLAWPPILEYILGAIVTFISCLASHSRPWPAFLFHQYWHFLGGHRIIAGIFVSHNPIFVRLFYWSIWNPPFFFSDLQRISVLMYDIIPTYDIMTTNSLTPFFFSPISCLSTYNRYFGI